MDWRIVVVLLPIIIAGSWAIFNIGRAALGQLQTFIDERKA
ncbi:photosystem II protein Y [filamentous cyanobacterium CCP5]|nr:photosystem II protein Y [filamentous cyanobacterium CCP5]